MTPIEEMVELLRLGSTFYNNYHNSPSTLPCYGIGCMDCMFNGSNGNRSICNKELTTEQAIEIKPIVMQTHPEYFV